MLREWCDCACIGGRAAEGRVDRSRRSPNVPPMYLGGREGSGKAAHIKPAQVWEAAPRRGPQRRGNGIPEKVVCGNSLRIRGKRMAVAEENMSVVVRGEKVLISLSLPLDSRLSFLRAIAGNELVGKSAVTLVTSASALET